MEGEPVSREAIVRYTMARSSETLVWTISPPGAVCHPQIQQHMHIVPEIPANLRFPCPGPCGSGVKFLGFGDIIWGKVLVTVVVCTSRAAGANFFSLLPKLQRFWGS